MARLFSFFPRLLGYKADGQACASYRIESSRLKTESFSRTASWEIVIVRNNEYYWLHVYIRCIRVFRNLIMEHICRRAAREPLRSSGVVSYARSGKQQAYSILAVRTYHTMFLLDFGLTGAGWTPLTVFHVQ